MRAKNNYALPIDKNEILHWHKKTSPAHVENFKHSLDFFAKEGTNIHAALDGVCVWIKNNSKKAGGKKYINQGNRIIIKHKNNEYTAYEHNKYKSAKIKIGQKIRRGQIIAQVGNTGWTNGECHLHFEIFNKPDKEESESETLQFSFHLKTKNKCERSCYN